MKLSDQHIKDILQETRVEYSNDVKLEEDILHAIDDLKGYESVLEQSKRRARIGLRVCMGLFALLSVSIFYSLFGMERQSLSEVEMVGPSVIVVVMLVVVFVLMQGSRDIFSREKM